eukprot:CAMPEP_0181042814 /NCGR_PEP_ID=MMETSP1070-20121207/12359_1 /TAXON_ID=265543 /ORGANISM="Minutocellus polymorphus, Strain NH13" /LENGTH=138 /DNA_ID=CAMNT_0023121069 /DNA_START=10 /DNA_END=426 /DNA_ORIENTATION=-
MTTTATANSSGGGSGRGPLAWITAPSPDINYNFISLMYGGGSALAVFLFGLEKALFGYYGITSTGSGAGAANTAADGDAGGNGEGDAGGDEEGALHEFTRQLEGLYLVFIPFFPCLLWSLAVRIRWLKGSSSQKDKKE